MKIKVTSKEKWEDISDVLTEEGAKKIKVGQVLIFNYEGSPINLKVMRKHYGKVWVKKIHLYTEEELKQIGKSNGVRQRKNRPAA